ncbi:MAG: SpoIIE family protein phosphatase [Acidobacteriaceae bacterium]
MWVATAAILCPFVPSYGAVPATSSTPQPSPSVLAIEGLGKGVAPLDGPWQFHLGDNPAWAASAVDDSTGHNGWEQITAEGPWGTQGHANYTGFAWYRRAVNITPAPGSSPNTTLLIPGIDDVYEIYWNGAPIGHFGSFPPHVDWIVGAAAQSYSLGQAGKGVLAVRVYKIPWMSVDDGTAGGFQSLPMVGSPKAITTQSEALDFHWLRGHQFGFALTLLYGLTSILSFVAWMRDRKQRLLFWMAAYTFMPALEVAINTLRMPVSAIWLFWLAQTAIGVREICQWFLLIYLLQLDVYPRLMRLVRIGAWISVVVGFLDGALSLGFRFGIDAASIQITDALLTAVILPLEWVPVLLVAYALVKRHRLDSARWTVAIVALLNGSWYSFFNLAGQGLRFTHWTWSSTMQEPLFTVWGNRFNVQVLLRTLLFLSIVYAVIRYSMANRQRQTKLEQEFQNARELQQILVPETLPAIPGFTLTSAYRPALEVGGDFFQIVPLEEEPGTLIVLGDVSGKGLQAAMTVSLIVGAIRTLAKFAPRPAEMLAVINQRLHGRLKCGFATCIVLLLREDGTCIMASAGHPAPYLNDRELELPGALPLGLDLSASYQEIEVQLHEGDHFSLYTDGLPEARSSTGELYGFERLEVLFGKRPSASQASQEAVIFGQEDDITVLTLTRLAAGDKPVTVLSAPILAGS